ncbi:hypothetical protein IGI01_12670 [Bacillus thuringiensis]|nr:hypothetical protein [Bacillus thuringiensis]
MKDVKIEYVGEKTKILVDGKEIACAIYMAKAVAESLSRYLWAVKLPPQNSAGSKKLGGRSTARKSPIGSTNNQWGMNKTPTDYSFTLLVSLDQAGVINLSIEN